jgi:hypothetical protein
MRTIKLPCYGIVIQCDPSTGAGTIESSMTRDTRFGPSENDKPLKVGLDAIEALILAHACAGVDVEEPGYVEGIETAVEKVYNQFDWDD